MGFQALRLLFLVNIFMTWHVDYCHGRREWHDNFYDFTVKNIEGKRVRLEKYRGTPSLVVNVASDCGYTDRTYRDLVDLSKDPQFEDRLNILAFPCNQFGHQEPQSNEEIKHYVKALYDVEFPLFAKVEVKGYDADPAWQYLTSNAHQEPTWNFWKFLVDSEGKVKDAWGPDVPIHSIYGELLTEALMADPYHYHHAHFDDEF
ncbi:glutathione peroxidase 7-like [Strongylocentrotus purpuratus]|uniref:Glutathione peroxidase n=1 Tax=Strongylocentrotus purpuratus TaxID=7668 RepID=A0A7M7T404_STRPU|nr:glutathione peroxidase 7-like [Strongylocentrotus purpuratus]